MTEKQKVKLFIASSRHASNYAQILNNCLRNYRSAKYELEPMPWWSPSSTLAAILDDLIEQTQKNDFAIIFLTSQLREKVPKGAEDIEKRKIRYNAIYEAGLFSGASGPSKDRCFMIASGTKEELPTDLLGLKFHFFEETDPLDEIKSQLQTIADNIGATIDNFSHDEIRPLRGLKLPLFLKDDLLRLEAHQKDGGRLKQSGAVVFINTPSPVEMEDKDFVERILKNMLDYQIKYQYVFENNDANITALARVIANLTSANLPESWKGGAEKAFGMIAAKLGIYLVKENPGLEYCVHNADTDDAVCYLRTCSAGPEPRWIEWEKGHKAKLVATEIDRIQDLTGCQSESHVFQNTHSVRVFDFEEKCGQKTFSLNELGRKIWQRVESWLPDAMKEKAPSIKKVCFGSAN